MAKSLAPSATRPPSPRSSPPPRIWQQLDRRRQQQIAQFVAELLRRPYPHHDPPETSHECPQS